MVAMFKPIVGTRIIIGCIHSASSNRQFSQKLSVPLINRYQAHEQVIDDQKKIKHKIDDLLQSEAEAAGLKFGDAQFSHANMPYEHISEIGKLELRSYSDQLERIKFILVNQYQNFRPQHNPVRNMQILSNVKKCNK